MYPAPTWNNTFKPKVAMVGGKRVEAPEGDYFVVCSFDKNHILLRSRMPYHIAKCIKNHPNHNKIPCPYDFTEYLDKDEYERHVANCEFKRLSDYEGEVKARLKATGNLCNIPETPYHPKDAEQMPTHSGLSYDSETNHDFVYDYNEDLFDTSGAIGRGCKQRVSGEPKRTVGRGRAAILELIAKRSSLKRSSSTSSCASSDTKQDLCDGQFDDDDVK